MEGFGSNQAMLEQDAQQVGASLTEYLSQQQQINQRQTQLTVLALALLAGAVLYRMASK